MKPEKRSFLAGMLCGGVLIATVGGASMWWASRVGLSSDDAAIYDNCLMANQGNTVSCDAYMRVLPRLRARADALEKKLNEGGAKMLASGASKREVVEWAIEMGGVGQQLSDAAGITLKELQSGKY
jgi:hypothetical protein